MSWDANTGSSGWLPYSYAGQPQSSGYYSQGTMQPHYANAYYYGQQSPAVSQPTLITVPTPGFSRNQPMGSLVPLHMRNRVGPVRCGHEGCLFAGTQKEVELHKMDRHLIFPPGWKEKQQTGKGKRKRDDGDDYVDEEAQFRASGGGAILGTDIKLDSPEAIAAWVEDRKKRWPSAKRVAEKAQSRQEALERGQILTEPPRTHRTAVKEPDQRNQLQRGRGRGRGRGQPGQLNGRTHGGDSRPTMSDSGWSGRGRGRGRGGPASASERGRGNPKGRRGAGQHSASGNVAAQVDSDSDSSISTDSSSSDSESTSGSDDSGSDMDPLKDAMSSKIAPPETSIAEDEQHGVNGGEPTEAAREPMLTNTQPKKQPVRRGPSQPPKPAYNPFSQRPNLLRNLLVPDIQATVSNLSQAIRFLVANDFLENVELKPGDAEDVPIQAMDTS